MKFSSSKHISVLLFSFIVFDCTTGSYRFADVQPILHLNDSLSVSVPKKSRYDHMDYIVRTLIRRPLKNTLSLSESKPQCLLLRA